MHTKGPWTIENPEQSLGSVDTACGTHRVAQAMEISVADRNSGHKERIANARLIAAAPELLELLVHIYEHGYDMPEHLRTRALIAKATQP